MRGMTEHVHAERAPRRRHPAVEGVCRWFGWTHLAAGKPRDVSRLCTQLRDDILAALEEDDAELTAGLRKLLEAKDCFVRAAIAETQFQAAVRGEPGRGGD